MKARKTTLSVLLAAVLLLALTPAAYAQPVPLRYSWELPLTNEPQLRSLFDKYNKELFDGKLRLTAIRYSDMPDLPAKSSLAETYLWKRESLHFIVISTAVTQDDLIPVLLHEMCHCYSDQFDPNAKGSNGHELQSFKDQVARLKKLGYTVYGY